ncbi:putative Rz-like protein [Pseudomonas phage phiNV3]|uniref:Putative Rz-like protein n=1 Tax=Pseudomonas phage phiNV3 TaxID=2079544 RepID=A0A2P0ZLN0_9CAUD|nr:putative Rz-like protein [Pseudomonas phage phiNV3]AVH86154.1 putative Rz-like protein [Pseudomonas phage phiNV3]
MRYAIIAVLVLATIAGLSSWGFVQAYSALQVANHDKVVLTDALAAEQERTARIQLTVLELEQRNAPHRAALQGALRSDPTWSAGAVPDPVVDGLCNRPGVRCKPRTVPAP